MTRYPAALCRRRTWLSYWIATGPKGTAASSFCDRHCLEVWQHDSWDHANSRDTFMIELPRSDWDLLWGWNRTTLFHDSLKTAARCKHVKTSTSFVQVRLISSGSMAAQETPSYGQSYICCVRPSGLWQDLPPAKRAAAEDEDDDEAPVGPQARLPFHLGSVCNNPIEHSVTCSPPE